MTGVTIQAETTEVEAAEEPEPAEPSIDVGTPAMPLWGWIAVLAVTAFGGLLRFWRLDKPRTLVFDETYYVKQGYSMFKAGYELRWAGEGKVVDPKWNSGNVNVFLKEPDFVVHPPFGKWMIGFGEWIFGPTSTWGWRFSAAAVGTISILMIALIARRLFGSTLLGVIAGLLLAVDGEHYVHSRTSLLDVFVMFWALAAFGCLVVDRDVARQRLHEKLAELRAAGRPVGDYGPWLGVRWWRIAGAVSLGLCAGVKWSGLYFFIAFALMSVFWDLSARRAAGIKHWFLGTFVKDGLLDALLMVPVAIATYLATWTGWFLTSGGYNRNWAAAHPSDHFGWVPGSLRGLWNYHTQMYAFNVGLASDHPYKANPWSWLIMGRPTAFFYESPKNCGAPTCSSAIYALGNPVIWWGGALSLFVLFFFWILRRDWRAGAVLAGLAGGYLPWFHYQHRTIYNFYSIAFTPWVILALTFTLGVVLGPATADEVRRRRGATAAGAVVLLAVLVFWFFLPIYSAQSIPQTSWSDRMWLQSWI
jgi:dolichyl-phosphate-mannose-protein mannosyltransferase